MHPATKSSESFFEPLLRVCHPRFPETGIPETHVANLDPSTVRSINLERGSAIKICVSRNLQGLPFTPVCSREQRKQVEWLLRFALMDMREDDLAGCYRPLAGEESRFGLSDSERSELGQLGLLFGEPETNEQLASGLGQHWPDGRGLFISKSRKLAAWVNYSEHLQLVSLQNDGSIRQAFERLCKALSTIQNALGTSGNAFAHSKQLGFLTANPAEVGTGGLRVVVSMRLPLLSAHPDFREACRGLGLVVRPTQVAGVSDVFNATVFGFTEAELVEQVVKGCEQLQAMEQGLQPKI